VSCLPSPERRAVNFLKLLYLPRLPAEVNPLATASFPDPVLPETEVPARSQAIRRSAGPRQRPPTRTGADRTLPPQAAEARWLAGDWGTQRSGGGLGGSHGTPSDRRPPPAPPHGQGWRSGKLWPRRSPPPNRSTSTHLPWSRDSMNFSASRSAWGDQLRTM